MTENEKNEAKQIKANLKEEIKKIESDEIGGWELFKSYKKYVLNKGSDEVIFSRGPELKSLTYHFITTPEGYETKNKGHIKVWGYGLEKEYYLIIDPQDYAEILSLVKQCDQLRETTTTQWEKDRDQKLANNPNLFFGLEESGTWAPVDKRQGLTFTVSLGQKEGKKYWLRFPKNHPSLVNLEKKEGQFYLIEGLENIPIEPAPSRSTGENNPYNFNRWVELTDKITITPYEVENDSEFSEKKIKDCDICQRNFDNTEKLYIIRRYHGQLGNIIQTCSNCYKNKEQEYLQNYESIFFYPTGNRKILESIKRGKNNCYANKKDPNGKVLKQENCPHCQPWKKFENPNSHELEKEVIKWLIQYFQTNNIQKIELENDKLTITNNNNNNNNNNNKEIKTQTQINNDYKLEDIQNWLQKKGQKILTYQELEELNNSPISSSRSPKKAYVPYLIGGGIVLIVLVVVLISYRFIRKVK